MPEEAAAPGQAKRLRCDTCGRESDTVSRVVLDTGYNRINARPMYNCPECYQRKNREREQQHEPVPPESG